MIAGIRHREIPRGAGDPRTSYHAMQNKTLRAKTGTLMPAGAETGNG